MSRCVEDLVLIYRFPKIRPGLITIPPPKKAHLLKKASFYHVQCELVCRSSFSVAVTISRLAAGYVIMTKKQKNNLILKGDIETPEPETAMACLPFLYGNCCH